MSAPGSPARQALKEKLQQQLQAAVAKVKAEYSGKIADLELQVQEKAAMVEELELRYEEEHTQLSEALEVMGEYEQSLEKATEAELKLLELENELNSAKEANEQLALKNQVLQKKYENLEQQYNARQHSQEEEKTDIELVAIEAQEEVVRLKEALLLAEESSLAKGLLEDQAKELRVQLKARDAKVAELKENVAQLTAKAGLVEQYQSEVAELTEIVSLLEADMTNLQKNSSDQNAPGKGEALAELQAVYEISQEELAMTKEMLEKQVQLSTLEKRNLSVLARKYKELDRSFQEEKEKWERRRQSTASSVALNADTAKLNREVLELKQKLSNRESEIQSLMEEKESLEELYRVTASRSGSQVEGPTPTRSSSAVSPSRGSLVGGKSMPTVAQVNKQLAQLESSLHMCSWRQKTRVMQVLLETDPKEQERLLNRAQY